MKQQSGNESENRRNMGKMSHTDIGWGGFRQASCGWEVGGVEIILDSNNENETGEESRTDSPVNGKSSSILLPVCFGASVFCEPDVFHVNIKVTPLRPGTESLQETPRNFEEQKKNDSRPGSGLHRGRPDRGRTDGGEQRRRQTAAHTIEKARFREECMSQARERCQISFYMGG